MQQHRLAHAQPSSKTTGFFTEKPRNVNHVEVGVDVGQKLSNGKPGLAAASNATLGMLLTQV